MQEEYEKGWDDPLLHGDYTIDHDRELLIRSLVLAREVLDRYAEVLPRDSMEILYVRTVETATKEPRTDEGFRFLGFDVGGTGYSLVGDFPPAEGIVDAFLNRLNERGLFNTLEDAVAFADFCQMHNLIYDPDIPYEFWEVYYVE